VTEDSQFEPDPDVVRTLEQEDSIWLNLKKTEVVLKIGAEAADYFRRRKLIDGQKIEKELADGGLLVSCLIAHPNQILPTVRYWLPHVRVISPEGLQGELEQQLKGYLNTV
jgi:predicted DNA-binding transcriptional regulator YafY